MNVTEEVTIHRPNVWTHLNQERANVYPFHAQGSIGSTALVNSNAIRGAPLHFRIPQKEHHRHIVSRKKGLTGEVANALCSTSSLPCWQCWLSLVKRKIQVYRSTHS